MANKQTQTISFGSVVGVIGTVLIIIGIAWLIAQNWRAMGKATKIILMIFLTALSLTIATIMKKKDYPKSAASLYILGGALFTLTVFVIAQVFSTDISPQGQAWLWLLSMIGVGLFAYLFESKGCVALLLIEAFFWVQSQSSAFFYMNNSNFIANAVFFVIGYITIFSGILSLYKKWKGKEEFEKYFQSTMGLVFTLALYFIVILSGFTTTSQGSANLILLSSLCLVGYAYFIDNSSSLVFAMKKLVLWVIVQYYSFTGMNGNDLVKPVILAFYLLGLGILFFGLSLYHRGIQHHFAVVYHWFTTFYALAFSYLLSFQVILPFLWTDLASVPTLAIVLLFVIMLGSIAVFSIGVAKAYTAKKVEKHELISVVSLIVLLAIVLLSSLAIKANLGSGFSYTWDYSSLSLSHWAVWIFANITLVAVILAVIFYGTWLGSKKMVNLGIVAFAIDVVTRYIGFIIDLHGYMTLAMIFITGGILLLFGGWGIEKWRRNLIENTNQTRISQGKPISTARKK